MPGSLFLVATPLGNPEDLTLRAIRVLGEVDLIAAEDTRRARLLLGHLGIKTPTISLFGANESGRVPQLLRRLVDGEKIAVISDAGTPAISDPGQLLHQECLKARIPVDVIPGPCAPIVALTLSGLPATHFRFMGFLPRKGGPRREALRAIAAEQATTVLFESPRRLQKTLQELSQLTLERQTVVAREMTKVHQEVLRGTASELAVHFVQTPALGEITVVIAGAEPQREAALDLDEEIQRRLEAGESPRDIAQTLRDAGCSASRRSLYNLALIHQRSRGGT